MEKNGPGGLKMKIYTDTPEGLTVIQNSFIDQYMPHASGEFVKIYLYLLRCANMDREISVSSVADVFDQTEKDVLRAISYWEKQNLIRVRIGEDGILKSLVFLDPGGYSPAVPEKEIKEPPLKRQKSADFVPAKKEISDSEKDELSLLFAVAEQYLKRTLSPAEMEEIVYYYDTLGFSSDLIEYLFEYCVMRGKTSHQYIHAVASSWANAGIRTVEEAKKESNLYNKNYITIMKTFGLKRDPAPVEQEMMSRWIDEYSFSMDLVEEACKRSIAQTHEPSFSYADSILRSWKDAGVHSMEDVEALDRQWSKRQDAKKETGHSDGNHKKTAFNKFPQRDYDYEDLGKKLFGHQ